MDSVHDNVIIKREKTGENKSAGEKSNMENKENREHNPRNAKALSILMIFFSVFLFLSLVSYTPKDFIHTRLSFEEFFGLFTGSDIVKAKVDATQNWLGLIGAIVSDMAYNSLIGYSILAMPFLVFILAVELFRKNFISPESKKKAWAAVIISVLTASSVAAFSNIPWTIELGREWFGAVGRMFAGLFSTLLGSFGAMMLFLAGMAFVLIKMTNVKVDILFEKIFNKGEDNIRKWKGSILQQREKQSNMAVGRDNRVSIFKKIFSIKKQEKTYSEPDPIINKKTEQINEEIHSPMAIKQEEPARIIKGSIDIKVNNPRNKINPILNAPAETMSGPGNSLVEKLIEENRNAGLKKPEYTGPEPEIIEYDTFETDIPDAINYETETNDNENIETTISEKLNNLNEIKPLEITIEKNDRIIVNEIVAEEEIDKRIEQKTKIAETNYNDDDLSHEYMQKPEVEVDNLTDQEVININTDDYFKDLPALQMEKPLVVTVKEKIPEVKTEQTSEKLVNPIGTSALDEEIDYVFPDTDYLEEEEVDADIDDEELKENARILQEKLETFKIYIENLTVTPGPVVTQYEFVPAAGIKISRIESLADDIAMALKAKGIRIIAPIPGKGTVGIEIPNKKRTTVRFKSIITSSSFQEGNLALPLAFGRTISGDVYCTDLAKMPHLLIAGSTGSGKSVGINTIITSLLYKIHPKYLKFVIIDPKKVELQQYSRLENHYLAVSPDLSDPIITDPESAVIILKSLCIEMDRRYDVLSKVGQRNIQDYNLRIRQGKIKDGKGLIHREMPYIVVVIDELADLMLTASKEVETPIIRLAQLARAIGIHLVVATQRPSVNVITGIIKANFPARIAYLVASKFDSRTILDMGGAEHLLGQGDMLFMPNGTPKPIRLQNAFLSTEEVERLTEHVGSQQGYSQPYFLPSLNESSGEAKVISREDRDPLFEDAARLIVTHQQGSVSLIQRRLKVGYARAGRIVDELESAGIVGPFDGSKARRVYIETEEELEDYL